MANFVSRFKNGVAEGVASDPHDTIARLPPPHSHSAVQNYHLNYRVSSLKIYFSMSNLEPYILGGLRYITAYLELSKLAEIL